MAALTREQIIGKLVDMQAEWNTDDCIDFAYYAIETIDYILAQEETVPEVASD